VTIRGGSFSIDDFKIVPKATALARLTAAMLALAKLRALTLENTGTEGAPKDPNEPPWSLKALPTGHTAARTFIRH
jgi:hypothetical protein